MASWCRVACNEADVAGGLAERTLGGWAVPFAVGLMAIGLPFIRYAIEVKQCQPHGSC